MTHCISDRIPDPDSEDDYPNVIPYGTGKGQAIEIEESIYDIYEKWTDVLDTFRKAIEESQNYLALQDYLIGFDDDC